MSLTNRRTVLRGGALAGLIAKPAAAHTARQDATQGKGAAQPGPAMLQTERERVMACGMTEAEAECWETIANAAGQFFALPELHPMDRQEVASAIHVIQNKLLSRPTYRRYLELAKAAAGRK